MPLSEPYTYLPESVTSLPLCRTDLLIYGTICSLHRDVGSCYATNRYFAERYRVSQSTVAHALCRLERMGLIRRITLRGMGNARIIQPVEREDIPITRRKRSPAEPAPREEKTRPGPASEPRTAYD